MRILARFYNDERGMAPYSILGISMLLIVGVAIYHFNNVDIQKAQERNELTFDMETFYSTVRIGQDLQQVARVSAENVILQDSMTTYGKPVDVNSEWETYEEFEEWKNKKAIKIKDEAEKEIFDFYYGGNEEVLEKQYYNPVTNFDFSNFIKKEGIEVSITPDSYDDSTKTQKALELNVGFKDGGTISAKNKFTGYELSMKAGTNVSVDARPFTMADKTYEFTEEFNDQEGANDFAWKLFWMQTLLGNLEANLKHDVRFATDDRVSYFFMHMLVAVEELETYGTCDYVNLAREFIRAWQGNEKEAGEFLSLLSLGLEESNIEQAEESMDAAMFVGEVAGKVQEISDSLIKASSYLDSRTVTKDGVGFEKSEVKEDLLSGAGTVQHLENAENTPKLGGILSGIETTKGMTSSAKNYITSDTVNMLSVSAHFAPLEEEYSEVRGEWEQAKNDFDTSQSKIISVRNGFSSLNSTINGKICENPVAAMLWFGDSNQNVKGLGDIITAKHKGTTELLNYYGELEKKIDVMDYEHIKDDYKIDAHYDAAVAALNDADDSIQAAKKAQEDYKIEKEKYDTCHVWECSREDDYYCPSTERRECLKVYEVEFIRECEETEKGGERCWTADVIKRWGCTCDLSKLQANYQREERDYKENMKSTEQNLGRAHMEVSSLQTQINAFFTDKGISGVYSMIDYPVLFSIYDGYYYHWNYTACSSEAPFPGRKYECANEMLTASLDVDETNYHEKMPASPLTYDLAHEGENNYGLYYIKFVIDKMDDTFGSSSINAGELEKAKEKLDEMKEKGFFAKINAILEPVIALVDVAGDINSGIAKIKNANKEFPNSKEHFNTLLPRPPFPFDIPLVDFEDQGFSVVHDIRLRADTSPGEIKIPFIKKPIPLGVDGNKTQVVFNPSFPIPYTPIFVYLWQFEITPSLNDDGMEESSTLWLMDTENSQVAPLLEMKVDEYGVPVPFYLHKPTQYKYEFTPKQDFSKKINMEKLPPVFVLAAGPFRTRFGPHMEPPDKEVTDDPVPIDVYFDREFAGENAVMTVRSEVKDSFVKTFITLTESVSLNSNPISDGGGKEITVSASDLKLLEEYGWSEVRADAYATYNTNPILDIGNIQGEDHARVYFIDPELESVRVRLERNGPNLKVINDGNKKIDVSVKQEAVGSCLFIFHGGNMSNSWVGSVEPGHPIELVAAPENNVIITAEVLLPERLKQELVNRGGIPLKLKSHT